MHEEVLKKETVVAWTNSMQLGKMERHQGNKKCGAASVIVKLSAGDAIACLRVVFTVFREVTRRQHQMAMSALQKLGLSSRMQKMYEDDSHRGMLHDWRDLSSQAQASRKQCLGVAAVRMSVSNEGLLHVLVRFWGECSRESRTQQLEEARRAEQHRAANASLRYAALYMSSSQDSVLSGTCVRSWRDVVMLAEHNRTKEEILAEHGEREMQGSRSNGDRGC